MQEIIMWGCISLFPAAVVWQWVEIFFTRGMLNELQQEVRLNKVKLDMQFLEDESKNEYFGITSSTRIDDLDKQLTWLKMEVHNTDRRIGDVSSFVDEMLAELTALRLILQEHKDQNTSYHISIGKKVSALTGEIEELKQAPTV